MFVFMAISRSARRAYLPAAFSASSAPRRVEYRVASNSEHRLEINTVSPATINSTVIAAPPFHATDS